MKSTVIPRSLLVLLLMTFSVSAIAVEIRVQEVEDFSVLGRQADRQRMPILLMFAADFCAYCERLEEDFLKPMLRSGDYTEKVLIRKFYVDGNDRIPDFNGVETSPVDMAERYAVNVTPTVVFIDGGGVELAPKRIGLTTPDFYGGYIDDAIDQALDILRRNRPMRVGLSVLGD